jgi:hypothetical protein
MACEKCWEDAYMLSRWNGKGQAENYAELLRERKDSPCTPEQEKYGNRTPEGPDERQEG